MRYFLTISYKGKAYNGWQIQTKQPHVQTIQSLLEERIELLLGKKTRLIVSGRTDAGVHAYQQVAHFDTLKILDRQNFIFKLNNFLPSDLVINHLQLVKPKAHARFDALKRIYRYQIITSKNPFLFEYAWLVRKSLDLNTLNRLADKIKASNYFKHFTKAKEDEHYFQCYITESKWVKENETLLSFTISANRFLRGMVRLLVGQMIQVVLGKTSEKIFDQQFLQQDNNRYHTLSAPEYGLTLVKITYPEHIFMKDG